VSASRIPVVWWKYIFDYDYCVMREAPPEGRPLQLTTHTAGETAPTQLQIEITEYGGVDKPIFHAKGRIEGYEQPAVLIKTHEGWIEPTSHMWTSVLNDETDWVKNDDLYTDYVIPQTGIADAKSTKLYYEFEYIIPIEVRGSFGTIVEPRETCEASSNNFMSRSSVQELARRSMGF
jgi:hypothetical protein